MWEHTDFSFFLSQQLELFNFKGKNDLRLDLGYTLHLIMKKQIASKVMKLPLRVFLMTMAHIVAFNFVFLFNFVPTRLKAALLAVDSAIH